MKKLKTICLVDETFQNSFMSWRRVIEEIMSYCNKHFRKFGIEFDFIIKKWDSSRIKNTFDCHIKSIDKYEKSFDRVIEFTNKRAFKDNPTWVGASEGNKSIIMQFFPMKISILYLYGLKKLTLHELGHTFGLKDTYFCRFSIMDNFLGVFTSRFTWKQTKLIKKYSNSQSQKP